MATPRRPAGVPAVANVGSLPAPGFRDVAAKSTHLDVCLTNEVEYLKRSGFDRFEFRNEAAAGLSLGDIDLSVPFLGRRLATPLMIGPMTGGTTRGLALNRMLAAAAQRFGLAMGVGSQRIGIERPDLATTFQVRDVAPDVLLFANFGAAQLVRGWGVRQALAAIRTIDADALFIHLNPVQEAIQGGDRDFRGFTARLTRLCTDLGAEGIPVFVREVCFGLSGNAARRLGECGVAGLDCGGAGGTSWAKVEALCATSARRRALGTRFGEWGIPTATALQEVRAATPALPLIASGGLRSGLDLAKSLALGADLGAMARPFLLKAHESESALHEFIDDVLTELRVCMFATGAATVADLRGRLLAAAPGERPPTECLP